MSVDKLCAEIKALEEEREALRTLCGVMIATLSIEANQEVMPPALIDMANRWERRFKAIKKRPGEPCPMCNSSGRRCAYCGTEGS